MTEVVEADGRVVAVRVRTRHSLVRSRRSACHRCGMLGLCGQCCATGQPGCQEWVWGPSLLRLVCRADDAALFDTDPADDGAASHLLRLRAELKAVVAARAALRDELEGLEPAALAERELSTDSHAAVFELMTTVSPADWQWAHHLLVLATQWGGSEEARAERATLYHGVREGELDSVARMVRRCNAARTQEAAKWADAAAGTGEYVVQPGATVDLCVSPVRGAAKTGYTLEPGTRFSSERELLDADGNMWLLVSSADPAMFRGRSVSALLRATSARALQWARVRLRGSLSCKGVIHQDGPEAPGAEAVLVRWDGGGSNASKEKCANLRFAGAPPKLPPGWLCVRPGGLGSRAVVTRARRAPRCCACGDVLVPAAFRGEGWPTVGDTQVTKGDCLAVAATREPVVVKLAVQGRILCSSPQKTGNDVACEGDAGSDENAVWYRSCSCSSSKVEVRGSRSRPRGWRSW